MNLSQFLRLKLLSWDTLLPRLIIFLSFYNVRGNIRSDQKTTPSIDYSQQLLFLVADKIRKKYASLGDSVVAVKLERSSKAGLGLSLAGHRDRSRMAVFICGLHPSGAAAKASPAVKVGDEILEVGYLYYKGYISSGQNIGDIRALRKEANIIIIEILRNPIERHFKYLYTCECLGKYFTYGYEVLKPTCTRF